MAVRVKWDQYETALLIDTFWLIEKNPDMKKTYISDLSEKLRRKAVLSGIEIDDVYRNINGITMQLVSIGHSFFPERPGLTTSAVFERMVHLYNNDKKMFDKILDEAKNMIVPSEDKKDSKKREEFNKWLIAKKIEKKTCNSILSLLDVCSKYCLTHRLCEKELWDIDDKQEFYNIGCKLLGMRKFRLDIKKNLSFVQAKVFPLYKQFLNDLFQDRVVSRNNDPGNEAVDDKEAFCGWLKEIKGLSDGTSRTYISSLKKAEEYAQEHFWLDSQLFSASNEIITKTATELFKDKQFRNENDKQHNRYYNPLRLYLEFKKIEIKDNNNDKLFIKEEKKKNDSVNENILNILLEHYAYGFNVESPIERIRFKRKYETQFGDEIAISDEELIHELKKCGFEYEGRIFVISKDAIIQLSQLIQKAIDNYNTIFYYSEVFEQNEEWLFTEKIVSPEMLSALLQENFGTYQYKPKYFLTTTNKGTEREALVSDIQAVWGNEILRTFDELKQKMPYVTLDKIKYALSSDNRFVWNSFETYTRKDLFRINDNLFEDIKKCAARLCEEKGCALYEELPIDDVVSDNYEMSETAVIEILFDLLSDDFSRNNRAITKKGEKRDLQMVVENYCRNRNNCTLSEIEQLMKDTVGEIRHPIAVEAISSVMVRVDRDDFISDNMILFNVDETDNALDKIITRNVIGIKEITTFGLFPYCGYSWNLFLVESFCPRFSKKFRYDCATANSKNAGAIIRKGFQGNYSDVMAEAVADSGINLSEKDIYDYLISSGLMIKRQYNDIEGLINKAKSIREGRI